MKKIHFFLFLFISVLLFTGENIYAQLTGIKTIPGDYTSIAAAITDLNTVGVGSGGVTFNIAAGYTETAGNLVITATGTSSNPVIFQKSGSGANPLITANTGVGTMDGIIKLSGSDFITFDGIDIMESSANTTTITQMEWGFALLKVDGTNGSQNNTIRNCVITLNKTNTATYGIYSANHTTASTISLVVTDRAGSNSSNKFYSNTIQNCYSGITINGYADATAPYNYYDHFNEIGVNGGNTIRLFGGAAITTYGIYTIYQDSLKVNNNNIGGGTGSTSTQYGIMISTANNASVTVYNNIVSDTTATTTSTTNGIALSNAGASGTDNTVIVKRNTVQGMTATAITSGALYGFYIYYTTAVNLTIDSNRFLNNRWGPGTTTNTGSLYGFYIYPFTTAPITGSIETISNNYVGGNRRMQSTAGAGTYYQMYIYYGNATVNAYNNIIENDTIPTTSTTYGMYVYNYYATTANYYNNIIRNITKSDGSTGAYYSIYISNAAYSGTLNYYNNSVYNINNGYAAAILYGHYIGASSVTKNIYGNTAYNLRTTMGGSVYGIYQTTGTTTNLYKNSVYGLRTSTGFAYGITIASGTTNNVYNNLVSDLRCDSLSSTLAMMGLYLSGGTYNNVYYNTVYLNAASTGSLFGTAACYASSSPTLDLRNNVFVNVSTPGISGGYTTAYYRSTSSLTTYASTSNNNDFYAGTPDTNHIIYYDGTNYARYLSDYKLLVSPRDANSVTENPPFINVSSTPYNLHLNAAIATQLESNGITVSGITTDYDDQARYPNSGYPINNSYPPTAPDIGADEIGGIPLDVLAPVISYTPLNNTSNTSSRILIASITDAAGVPTSGLGLPVLYWKKNSGAYTAATGVSLGSNQYQFTFGSGVVTGDVVYYYICAQDNNSPTPNVGCYPSAGASGFTPNPPAAAVPPTNPSSYIIAQPGLSGDYTVGITAFNQITGKNITFKKITERVIKDVFIEDPANRIMPGKDEKINSETSTNSMPKGRYEKREVEEIKWIPMENGREYTGDLYVKKVENPNFPYPTNTEGVYATLTAAIADYNIRGVSGPTRFLLTDASYTTGETYPLTINVNNDLKPTSVNTFTIKPATGVTANIAGTSNSSQIFKIINNNYIIIDGSNVTNGTTRNLTIQNTGTTAPQVMNIGSTGTTPINNITVKNCNLINGTNTSSSVVVSDGTVSGSAGYFNNINIQNNSFGLSYIALYSIAVISTGNGSGLNIIGNDFNNNTSQVRLCRIYVQGVDGATVSGNNMGNDSDAVDAGNITGVWFATGTMNSTITNNTINNMCGYGPPRGIAVSSAYPNANITITGNNISGLRSAYSSPSYGIYVFSTTSGVIIRRNMISNMRNYNTGGYGVRGINIATSITPANIDIINNMLWDIIATSDASVTYWGIGIALDAAVSTINVYDNSVNLYGTYSGYSSATIHTAFYVGASVTNLNTRDNIFVNSYDNTNSTTDKSYSIYSAATNTAYTDINYNDYYVSGTPGTLGYLGADKLTLADWRTATGKDLNSISGNPLFFSDNNLHIDSTQSSPVNNAGQSIVTVTDDIDGNPRHPTTPDIGADEGSFSLLTPPPPPSLYLPANNSIGQQLSLTLVWYKSTTAVTYRVQVATDAGFSNLVVNDSTLTDSTKALTGLNPLTNYWWRVNAKNAAGTGSWSSIFTFKTLGPATQVTLFNPPNNATNQPLNITFNWSKAVDQTSTFENLKTKAGSKEFYESITGYWFELYLDTTQSPVVRDTTLTDTTKTVNSLNYSSNYWWRVKAKNQVGYGNFSVFFKFTTMPLPPAQVNLKVIPGGFYNTSTGQLNMRDTLRVYLVDSSNCQRVDSNKVVIDSVNFTVNLSFTNAQTGNYYLYIYHRNHLPVASRLKQSIVRGSTASYDFTTDSAKTYGYNCIKVSSSPVLWAMIPGDANRDEFIDALDQGIWITLNGFDGYQPADFNGDLFVDALDQNIWITFNGLSSYLPCPTPEAIFTREVLLNEAKKKGIILTTPYKKGVILNSPDKKNNNSGSNN